MVGEYHRSAEAGHRPGSIVSPVSHILRPRAVCTGLWKSSQVPPGYTAGCNKDIAEPGAEIQLAWRLPEPNLEPDIIWSTLAN